MSTEVKTPVLPESVEDAVIAAWHKKPGDTVRRDENLVDLETDKVVLEVPSPVDGVLDEIVREQGETVTSDDVLARITEGEVADEDEDEGDESGAADDGDGEEKDADEAKKGDRKAKKSEKKDEDDKEAKDAGKGKGGEAAAKGDSSRLSPATRRIAEQEGVDPSEVEATGRGGRLTKGDVVRHLKGGGARPTERVKMTRLRTRIAQRLKDAQNTAAILTTFNEVDLKAVMDLRAKYKAEFENRHGVKLGIMSFFVKAVCDALSKHPVVNASIEGEEIVYHGFQDIGIAVSTERGLMVPVIRNAEQLTLAEIENAIRGYAEQARTGSIQLEDLQGGTFTLTNGGTFGSMMSTPLLNPPQSAILGMHAIKDRPVVVEGQIVVRPMMYVALSYDHRIIDGKDSVQFLVAVKEALEDPARLLLDL